MEDIMTPAISVPKHQNEPLSWHHQVQLIGDKCPNPRIHTCDACNQPILIYGRLVSDSSSDYHYSKLFIGICFLQIPCKHVFCLDCAHEKSKNSCMKCHERVIRVEKSGLGSIFRCRKEGCKRTYLSHRDLLAHIKHRHSRKTNKPRRS
jgi:hypothetical protein